MDYEFTIIVPVYNEEGNLERLESELTKYLAIALMKTKILFVNDGSVDRSQTLIEEICKRNKHFHFIQLSKNNGLSAALKAGFDHVDTKLTGYMDSDLQTSPNDFNMLLPLINEYNLVNGVRSQRKDPFLKYFSSIVANRIRRSFTNDGMDDTGCPLKIIQTDYAKHIPMFNGLHRFLPAMILLQKGKVIQVPVQHFPRIAGVSNFGLLNRLFGPLLDCFAYSWMKRRQIRYEISKKG